MTVKESMLRLAYKNAIFIVHQYALLGIDKEVTGEVNHTGRARQSRNHQTYRFECAPLD